MRFQIWWAYLFFLIEKKNKREKKEKRFIRERILLKGMHDMDVMYAIMEREKEKSRRG